MLCWIVIKIVWSHKLDFPYDENTVHNVQNVWDEEKEKSTVVTTKYKKKKKENYNKTKTKLSNAIESDVEGTI